jgi:hypothetical protein
MSIFSKSLRALYGKDQNESLDIDISARAETDIESPAKVKIGPSRTVQPPSRTAKDSLFKQGYVAGQKEIISRIKENSESSREKSNQFVELTSEIISSIRELKETLISEFETICKQEIPKLTVDVLRKLEQNEPAQFRAMVSSFMQSMAMEDIAIHCSPQVFDILSEGSEKRFDPILILEEKFDGSRMEIKFA